MRFANENELLNLDERTSVLRSAFSKEINLASIDILPVKIPSDFQDYSFYPSSDTNLRDNSLQFGSELRDNGYSRKLLSGLHEAVRNAYQHGNRKDNSKKIILAKKIDEEHASFFVGDEGGIINQDFLPYILRFRQSNLPIISSFYRFSSKPRAYPENEGLGMSVMHLVFDSVQFFRNEHNGLLVLLEKDARNK